MPTWLRIWISVMQFLTVAVWVVVACYLWSSNERQEDLVKEVRDIAERINPPVDPATQQAADKAFAGKGLDSGEIERLIKLAAEELAKQLNADPNLHQQLDETLKAIDTTTPDAARDKAEKNGVLAKVADAVADAGRRLGLPAEKIKELRDQVLSLPAEAVVGLVKGIGTEAGKGIYRLIFGSPDKQKINVTCSCCECADKGGKGKEKDKDKQGTPPDQTKPEDETEPDDQPPPDAGRGGRAAYRIIVHFPLDRAEVKQETQREEIWRAKALYLGAVRGRKLYLSAFTDTTGTEGYNEKLRTRRVANVEEALGKVGIPERDIVRASTSGTPLPVPVDTREPIPGNRVVIIDFR